MLVNIGRSGSRWETHCIVFFGSACRSSVHWNRRYSDGVGGTQGVLPILKGREVELPSMSQWWILRPAQRGVFSGVQVPWAPAHNQHLGPSPPARFENRFAAASAGVEDGGAAVHANPRRRDGRGCSLLFMLTCWPPAGRCATLWFFRIPLRGRGGGASISEGASKDGGVQGL